MREDNKIEEGFKSSLKRSLHLLAAPYPINLISIYTYIYPGACVLCFYLHRVQNRACSTIKIVGGLGLLTETQKYWVQFPVSWRPGQWNIWENKTCVKPIQPVSFIYSFSCKSREVSDIDNFHLEIWNEWSKLGIL